MTFKAWATPAIRVAAAGLGAAVAGPLGGALGGVLGAALIETYADKFGEEATKKLLDLGADSLVEKLKGSSPNLESAYRETLRLSLKQIHEHGSAGFDGWFANWDLCLKTTSIALALPSIQPDQLTPDKLDGLLRNTLERLDAQGAAIRKKSQSLDLQCRDIPHALLLELNQQLSQLLEQNFRALIVKPEYEQAWKQAQLAFQNFADATLRRIDEKTDVLPRVAEDTAAIRKMLEYSYANAVREGRVPDQRLQAKDAEISRLTEELRKLQEQLAARSSEPAEAKLSELLAAGDLGGALHLKTQQVETRRSEAQKLPRDLFELGAIHELRFDWPNALAAYREAWQLERNPKYGFKYAYSAQRQNHFSEAISAYKALRERYTEAAHIALTLNNLANLYRDTQRMQEAEDAFREALSTYRELAQADPRTYLPYVASVLNNRAILYRNTQRAQEAEDAFREALSTYGQLARINPDAYLPCLAMTLNNLAILYSDTQRMQEAEDTYDEALSTYGQLAQTNPETYLSEVATTLNNLAILYCDTQRMQEAEDAYREALSTYRKLAQANPDAYLPCLSMTLDNLANFYSDTQRMQEAENAYRKALSTYRQLAQTNPDAYLPYIARTLNNLAVLYGDTQRMQEAENAYRKALSTYRKLAQANPDAYLPYIARTLNNLAVLYRNTRRMQEAEALCCKAEKIIEPLWRVNPEVHGDQTADILLLRSLLCESLGTPRKRACALARRAFAAAYNLDLKQTIQQQIDRMCN